MQQHRASKKEQPVTASDGVNINNNICTYKDMRILITQLLLECMNHLPHNKNINNYKT